MNEPANTIRACKYDRLRGAVSVVLDWPDEAEDKAFLKQHGYAGGASLTLEHDGWRGCNGPYR